MDKRRLTIEVGPAATLVISVVLFLFHAGCHRGPQPGSESDTALRQRVRIMYEEYHQESFPRVRDVTVEEAMRLREEEGAVFVDVRSEAEQAVSMLPGAITDDEFLENPDEYSDRPLIGYCTISYRSGVLAKDLRGRGSRMMNLRGGVLAWVHEGGRVYHEGEPTQRVHVYSRDWNLLPEGYEAVW